MHGGIKNKHEKTRIMYHMISDQLAKGKKSGLRVSPEMFERQLKYFKENGWKFIKMSELKNHENENKWWQLPSMMVI